MQRYIAKSGRYQIDLEESVSFLPASSLNRAGVFSAALGTMTHLTVEGVRFLVRTEAEGESVTIWLEPFWSGQKVQVTKTKGPTWKRFRFVCWYTGKSIDKFFVIWGGLESRYTLEFNIIRETPPATNPKQAEINRAKARLSGADGRWPAWGADRQRLLRRPDLAEALAKTGSSSTHAAPHFGAELGDQADVRKLGRRAPEVCPAVTCRLFALDVETTQECDEPALQGDVLLTPSAVATQYPVLPIDLLIKHKCPQAELGLRLSWPEAGLENVFIRWWQRTQASTLLMLKMSFDPLSPTTAIVLRSGKQRHPKTYMRCPVTGSIVSHLYYRAGRFASAKAQNLEHPSRRRSETVSIDETSLGVAGGGMPISASTGS